MRCGRNGFLICIQRLGLEAIYSIRPDILPGCMRSLTKRRKRDALSKRITTFVTLGRRAPIIGSALLQGEIDFTMADSSPNKRGHNNLKGILYGR